MDQKPVLITGMSGLIGQVCREALAGDYDLRALNRSEVEGVSCHRADIFDLEAIQPAFEGVDTVVHLAAMAQGNPTWKDVLPHNVVGTYNVFEASRRAGVQRVIFASSGAAVSGCERDSPYRALVEGRYQELDGWENLDGSVPRSINWKGSTPLGTTISFQIRTAADAYALEKVAWRGPSGPDSWFTKPVPVPPVPNSSIWFQYRARLATPNGGASPVLTRVEVNFQQVESTK